MEKVVVKQSLLDIAIQCCGSVEAVFDIAVLNDLSITDELVVGKAIQCDTVADVNIANYYRNRNLKPATALSLDDKITLTTNEGISYWAINDDFVVQ